MIIISLRRFRLYLRLLAVLAILAFLGLILPRLLAAAGDRLFPPGQAGPEGLRPSPWDVLAGWLAWLVQQLRRFMEGAWFTEGVTIREGFDELC